MSRFIVSLLAVVCLVSVGFASEPEILPVPDSSQIWNAIESLEDRVARLEKQPVAVVAVPVAPKVVRSSVVVTSVPQSYSARWHSNDGRSLRQHAIEVHGFDPGLSDAQLAAQHDAYHDVHGGDSPPRVNVSWSNPPAVRTRTTTVQSAYVSECPGGVCPTSRTTTVQSSGGLLGFGIFGRRR